MSIDTPSIAATVTPDPHAIEAVRPEPFARRAGVWLAGVLWVVYVVTACFALYLAWVNNPQAALERTTEAFFAYVSMSFLLVTFGALIVSNHPENRLGGMFCISGISLVVYLLAQQYALYSLQYGSGLLPGTTIAMWLATGWPAYMAGILVASFVQLLFPTGTLLSPRWRPVAWLAGVVAVLYIVIVAFRAGPLDLRAGGPVAYNPLGIAGADGLFAALEFIAGSAYGLVVIASTASVVLRFRQAQDEERQQIKWFAYAAGALLLTLGLTFVGWLLQKLQALGLDLPLASWLSPAPYTIIWICWIVSLSAIPLAMGIAILKYRLYDIDLLINRTLVYVPLTAILAGVYTASIAVFQRLFPAITGQKSDAAVVLTTLLVAAAFTPIKNALQGLVDKYLKENPHTTRRLDSFGEQVAEFVRMSDARQLIGMLLDEMVQAFNARGGAAYLEHLGRMQLVHQSEGWRDEDAAINIHLEYDGKQFSEIKLGEKRSGQVYTAKDQEILQLNASRVAEAVWLAQRSRWHLATGEWSSPVQRKQTESRHNQGK